MVPIRRKVAEKKMAKHTMPNSNYSKINLINLPGPDLTSIGDLWGLGHEFADH